MFKKERYIITGIDQDTAPDKRKTDVAYDAENIRIINNGRNLSIKPIKDSKELSTIDDIAVSEAVIGSIEVDGNLYLFIENGASNDK